MIKTRLLKCISFTQIFTKIQSRVLFILTSYNRLFLLISVEKTSLQGITVEIDKKNESVRVDATLNQASVMPRPPLRNITIQRPGSSLPWYLMICELRVYVAGMCKFNL